MIQRKVEGSGLLALEGGRGGEEARRRSMMLPRASGSARISPEILSYAGQTRNSGYRVGSACLLL
jgi:hypothetical protein